MKNERKGFTLIELLAIIVILAIIAVITVPIILNVIDNSKKGAIKNSAYGYKDAISKYYITSIANNEEVNLQGEYIIADGKLTGNNINNVEIPTTGNAPKGGYLSYENNILKNGCIVFDDYKVEIENGEISLVTKGTCEIELGTANHTISPEGFATSKSIFLEIEEGNSFLLVKTPANTTSNVAAIPCTENEGVYVCEGSETTTLETNSWYKFTSNVTLTLIENGTVSYNLSNGITTLSPTNIIVDGIDRTPPVITTGDLTCGNEVRYYVEANDSESGIEKYMFSKDNGVTWTEFSGNTFEDPDGDMKVKYKVINKTYNNSGENEFNTTISETYTMTCTPEPE